MTYTVTYTYRHLARTFEVDAYSPSEADKIARKLIAAPITSITEKETA